MIELNVHKILKDKNKSRYWLVKEMQTNYNTVNKMCDNTAVALQLETIEKLCKALKCTPNDLFIIK
ncbi:hypothetical protein AGMMS50284_5610 [Clostridia bacterium]|nr:hypothetical protein AGMMS50284_5610 [Clostridia bacterium]